MKVQSNQTLEITSDCLHSGTPPLKFVGVCNCNSLVRRPVIYGLFCIQVDTTRSVRSNTENFTSLSRTLVEERYSLVVSEIQFRLSIFRDTQPGVNISVKS